MMLPTFASCQQEKPFPDDAVDKVYEYLPEWQAGYLDIHQISTGRGNAAYLIFPDGLNNIIWPIKPLYRFLRPAADPESPGSHRSN